jgi:RNA polymerase sigma factor (sigma-70 family)
LQLDAPPDEPDHTAQFLVFHLWSEGTSSFIVFWDVVPMVVRRLSAADVKKKQRESLPFGGPRERWAKLERLVDDKEVVSAYFEEGIRRPNADDLALRILDHLERSQLVGRPSRKTGAKWLPLHDPNPAPRRSAGLEGERFDLKAPNDLVGEDVRIDLDRSLRRLDRDTQEVLRLYYIGHTDGEIGKMLGISHQAVNKRRQSAIKKLRDMMSS